MNKRYLLLDNFRGLCLINMILYHAIWDIVYIYMELIYDGINQIPGIFGNSVFVGALLYCQVSVGLLAEVIYGAV